MKKLILIMFIFSFISCKEKISTTGSASISSATVKGVGEFCNAEGIPQVKSAKSRSSSNSFYGITITGDAVEIVLKDENGNTVENVVIEKIYNLGEEFCYIETRETNDNYNYEYNKYVFSKKSGKGSKATFNFEERYGFFAFTDDNGNTYLRADDVRYEGMSTIYENGIMKLSQNANGVSMEMLSRTRGIMLINKFGTIYTATDKPGYLGHSPNRFSNREVRSRSGGEIYISAFGSYDTDEFFEFENGKFTKIAKSGGAFVRTFVSNYAKDGFVEYNMLRNKNTFYIIKDDCSEIMKINSQGVISVYPTDMKNYVDEAFIQDEYKFSIVSPKVFQLGQYLITKAHTYGQNVYMVNLNTGEVTFLPELDSYPHFFPKPGADDKSLYIDGVRFFGPIGSERTEYFVAKWNLETRTIADVIKSRDPIKIIGNGFRQ